MEESGLVSEMSSNGSREVLVPRRDWFEILSNFFIIAIYAY
jgi:DNA segregation ATPase FtsK/SpoIIIE-like protein